MATAEFAVAMPAVVLVLVLALSAVVSVMDQVRCVDAARATARALARGDPQDVALAEGHRLGPVTASFTVTATAREVRVSVRGRPAPALRWLGDRAAPVGAAAAMREDVTESQWVP
jgi:Flp pilus assembly protein TadG